MNRRGFLSRFLKATAAVAVAPTILPAATTYARNWVRSREGLYVVSIGDAWHGDACGSILRAEIVTLTTAQLQELFDRYPLPGSMWIENFTAEAMKTPRDGLYDFLTRT